MERMEVDQCAGAGGGALRRSNSAPMIASVRFVVLHSYLNFFIYFFLNEAFFFKLLFKLFYLVRVTPIPILNIYGVGKNCLKNVKNIYFVNLS